MSAAKICMRMDDNGDGKDCEIPGITQIEKIIQEVRRYPALYDPSNTMYRNHDCKERIWRQISYDLKLEGGPIIYKAVWSLFRKQFLKSIKWKNIMPVTRYDTSPFMLPCDTLSNTSRSQQGEEDDNFCDDEEVFVGNGHRSSENSSVVRNGIDSSQVNGKSHQTSTTCEDISIPFMPFYLNMRRVEVRENGHQLSHLATQHPVDTFLAEISTKLKALNPAFLNQAKSEIYATIKKQEINQLVMVHQILESNQLQPLDMRSRHLSRPCSSNSSSASYDSQVANCNSPRSPPVEDSTENHTVGRP